MFFQSKLWKKYKVKFTPTLVLIDGSTGKLITDKGRDCLSDDVDGKNFPWETKSLENILDGKLLKGSDTADSNSALTGNIKGFYFAAHWVSSLWLYNIFFTSCGFHFFPSKTLAYRFQ